ncbi:hypothetical protein LTR91_005713 [Friedmanniomyces endolithicus]|uniref:Myb-like domain-containing protein n=1 Tax=Friedmanniomyces endolithicus TaxID=329885 RepID=A0AAN6FHF6_9PEZI|nr:hypothetical protein LTR35_011450 [Friedmanniomyces endolithicus]KAK0288443.1 hypothetical protein LTS00_009654 [Friedmanniomyces endolithicus]KAK0307904.1 hypothetical protein LTR01_005236 [Friedmanniomyces endolithicus]KAK0317833.1 hypothetical protein LTR82_011094 [Friedmanniomyces endolithicus]KAK0831741.1 hypothetical protein LTR73_003124 [Friedmanniomyces endolithicus]
MAARRNKKAAAPKKPPTPRGSPQLSKVTKSRKAPSEDGSNAKKKIKRWTVAELTLLHEARQKETPYAQIIKDLHHTHTELACRLRMCGDKKKFLAEEAEERRRNKQDLAYITIFGSGAVQANFDYAAQGPKMPRSYYQPPAKKGGRKSKAAAPRALLPKPESPVLAPVQPQHQAMNTSGFDCLALAAEQAQRAELEGAAILAGMSGMMLAPQMTYVGVRQASIAQRGSLSHILN